MFSLWIAVQVSFALSNTAQAQPRLPVCPPEWKLELVAAAPKVRYPSVVVCAPDGRVFVAEDPMDISAPSANLALGRILCLHPDGHTTVFAEKLHAVFGLQYLEGKLYVLHNPKFSVFTDDDGVGKDRVDLIESTNPNPWALDWNDHVPANFRLGMDGYFYVAVGDKGVFGAVGKDGKRFDLFGGGILRLRPNATELEAYSTGVRNILDVALNAEDELFTYDNTDEQQWMSRLTHMVDGGFYGYPYDFIPQQPHTLWMMADYGGGAATGAFAYNEDALPAEYRGNLFLADFGKRQLIRVRVERGDGTYKAASRQDFFTDVPEDFRPVGITLGADESSIYICDWNHRDTKAKAEVGRLFKLSYTGKTHATQKPDWYLPAAMGRGCSATLEALVSALAHPARNVRLTAQRQIVEKAGATASLATRSEATALLTALVTDPIAQPHARWHAIWALDGIDAGASSRSAILAAIGDRDPSVRRQAIRQLGLRRVREATRALSLQLRDADASIRFQAATALGRIGDSAAVAALIQALDEKDLFARYAAFTALNRIGRADPSAWGAIARGLENDNPRIRESTTFALRETYDAGLVSVLAGLVRDRTKPASARQSALRTLAGAHRQKPPWQGEWWAYHPVNAPPPQKTVEWPGTKSILAALREGLDAAEPSVRSASLQGILETKEIAAAPKLRELFPTERDPEIKRQLLAAFGALKDAAARELVRGVIEKGSEQGSLLDTALITAEQIGGDDLAGAITRFLQTKPSDRNLVLRALETLGNLKAAQAIGPIAAYGASADSEVRQHALTALVRLGADAALSHIPPLLDHASLPVRRSAVVALGMTKSAAAVPHLLKAFAADETRAEAIGALASVPDARALDAYFTGLTSRDALLRQKCRQAVLQIRKALLPEIERRLPDLAPEIIAELQAIYRTDGDSLKSRLFSVTAKKPDASIYLDFALNRGGDAVSGKLVFNDLAGAACAKCHTVGREGGNVGPDLTTIGSQYGRHDLAESILFPSKAVREGYQQTVIETKDDETISGLVSAESAEALTLRDSEGTLHRIAKARFKSRSTSALSLMPEGLHEGLSPGEFADLVAYLESLKDETSKLGKPGSKPVPIIFDTDIGTDVDDAYALVAAARSPQLDLRAVTTVNGNVAVRSAIARKLLLLMGKDKIPVASGQAAPMDGHKHFWGGWEGKGLLDEDEAVRGISTKAAPELIIEVLSASSEKIVIVSVGGLSNVAAALERAPQIKSKIERLVIMGGCVRPMKVQGKSIPERLETNLHNDVDAAAIVFNSGLPITLVPAEVTFRTNLYREDFDRIQKSSTALAQAITRMTLEWEPRMKGFMKGLGVESYYDDGVAMLHDPLAVCALADPTLVKTERLSIRLEVGKGTIRTVEDRNGSIVIELVTDADLPRLSRAVSHGVVEAPAKN